MNVTSTLLLAFAMSADAFAAAIGKGAALKRPRLSEALRVGLIFGVIEALTPIVGWLLGRAAVGYISAWDHWIAFALLTVLGLRMIHTGLRPAAEREQRPERHSFWLLAATAFATSIDAMVIGVTLALVEVDIVFTAILIGLATLLMVTIGIMLGRLLGSITGRWAEVLGGVILIVIGVLILAGHTARISPVPG